MLDLVPKIVERIKEYDEAQPEPLFIEVSGAAELDEVLTKKIVTEGAYVVQMRNNATKADVYQRMTEQFMVVTTCRNVNNKLGDGARSLAKRLSNRVWKALSRLSIDGADPLEFVNGDIVEMRNGNHIWQDIYLTEYTIDPNQQQP